MASQRDEIAIIANGLINLGVILLLFNTPRALELVVARRAARNPKTRATVVQFAKVKQAECTGIVILTNRHAGDRFHFLAAKDRAIIDGATSCRCGRAVDIGRAEVDVHLLHQLGIKLLVRINGIVAGVIQRKAIKCQRNTVAVKATDTDVAAR